LPTIAIVVGVAAVAQAQVPPKIAKQLVALGRGVCTQETAQLYRPLHPSPPYSAISIARDISFGSDPKNVIDVFAPEKGGGSRPVLIYVPGGPGNKRLAVPNNDVFYDNIPLWAVKNGMVGVLMQRRPGETWDDPGRDIGKVVRWVEQNIARYKGDPGRVFMWAQSAGNIPVGTYVGHPEFYSPTGVGLKGVVFMSGSGLNILPATPPTSLTPPCQPLPGIAPAVAGAPPAAQPDADTELARSSLPGLINSKLPFLISVAELDTPRAVAFGETLRDQLCKAGRCPTYLVFKNHSHISEVMSPNTADDSVTGPILKWMRSAR
jgi:triacylglycerol lipase